MKHSRIVLSIAAFVIVVIGAPTFVDAAQAVFKKVSANQFILQGKKAFIQRKGDKPVVIKDDLAVKGNISMLPNATIDGVDISELATLPVLPTCDVDSTVVQTADGWACDTSGDAIGVTYANVVTVAESGANFTTISEAIASITDADGLNRYMVWIAPGYYQESFVLPDYVDIQGATRQGVFIAPNTVENDLVAITSGGNNAVRNITLTAVGTSDVTGILVQPGHTVVLENVTAYLSEIVGDTAITVNNDGGYLTIRNSTISSGAAVVGSYPVMSSGSLVIENSQIESSSVSFPGNLYGIAITGTGYRVSIKNSSITAYGNGGSEGATNCIGLSVETAGVSITVEDTTVDVSNCETTIRAAAIEGSGSTTVTAYNSRFMGADPYAVTVTQGAFKGASILVEGGVADLGDSSITCVHAYGANFAALTSTCSVL